MKLIKLGLISVVVLFGIITLISSLLPSHIRISRAIDVNAGRSKVLQPLSDTKTWAQWNEFISHYQHISPSVNRLEADDLTVQLLQQSDSLISSEWNKRGGNKFGSGFVVIKQDSVHCTVQWYFDFHVKWYPWEKFQSIVFDQQFGPIMEKSLANLKRMAEQ